MKTTTLLISGALLLSPCFLAGARADVLDLSGNPVGLIDEWPGNGDCVDSVTGVAGTPYGAVTFVPTPTGDMAFSFNGANARVFIPDTQRYFLTHSLSVTAWIYPTAYPRQHGYILLRGDDRAGLDPYTLQINSDGTIDFQISALDANIDVVTKSKAPLNTWTFVAASLDDSNGVMAIYLNNDLSIEDSTSIRPFGRLDPGQTPGIGIGNVQSKNYDCPFIGAIRDVRLYDTPYDPNQLQP